MGNILLTEGYDWKENRRAWWGSCSPVLYLERFPNLKENTVRDWRNTYRLDLKKRGRDRCDEVSEGGISISGLPQKKVGVLYFLVKSLTNRYTAYLTSFRESGAVVNIAITMACAEGIVRSANSNMLAVNAYCPECPPGGTIGHPGGTIGHPGGQQKTFLPFGHGSIDYLNNL